MSEAAVLRPKFRAGISLPGAGSLRLVFPFPRSLKAALALLILLKTGADLFAHGREHRSAQAANAAAGRRRIFGHVQQPGTSRRES